MYEGVQVIAAGTFDAHRGSNFKTSVPPKEVEDSGRVLEVREGSSRFSKSSSRILKVCSDSPKKVPRFNKTVQDSSRSIQE